MTSRVDMQLKITLVGLQIEYLVVSFDDAQKEAKLSLRQADILEALAGDSELIKQGGGVVGLVRGPVKLVNENDHQHGDSS